MSKIGMIAHIDRSKTSLTLAMVRIMADEKKLDEKAEAKAEVKNEVPSATKTQVIKSSLAAGVTESAAVRIADQLEKDGFELKKAEAKPASQQLRVQPAKS